MNKRIIDYTLIISNDADELTEFVCQIMATGEGWQPLGPAGSHGGYCTVDHEGAVVDNEPSYYHQTMVKYES